MKVYYLHILYIQITKCLSIKKLYVPVVLSILCIFEIHSNFILMTYSLLLQGRCNRDKPPCKYFHPPQHLKDQLLINGRNHLALKNALLQQMGLAPGQPMVPSQVPAVVSTKI